MLAARKVTSCGLREYGEREPHRLSRFFINLKPSSSLPIFFYQANTYVAGGPDSGADNDGDQQAGGRQRDVQPHAEAASARPRLASL